MIRFALAALLFGAAPILRAADVMKGSQLYGLYCASCHGASGMSSMPNAPSFALGERMIQPDQVLLTAVRSGRGAMPGFFGVLNEREMLDVIAYMRTLR